MEAFLTSPVPILSRVTAEFDSPLAAAALTARERRVLERLVDGLRTELGDDLRAVWLYGSRARGDAVLDESDIDRKSDIDLMVIADGGKRRHGDKVFDLAYEAATQEGDSPTWYSVQVHDPDWLRGRREIESFFIQEVDRDKLVLTGGPL
jgi:predicted nucleotidyltransferase